MSFIRDLSLPPDAALRAQGWQRAEAGGDDAMLTALRELEAAVTGLPDLIAGLRRGRLLAADSIGTTWEGWRSHDGARILMRVIQPRWRHDPVMRRRFLTPRAAAAVTVVGEEGTWPCLMVAAPGVPVTDRLPVEDAPTTATLARLLGSGLAGLAAIHDTGAVHGGPIGPLLTDGAGGACLHWLDGHATGRSTDDDLRALATVIVALDPTQLDPVGQLAAGWMLSPPPAARDGQAMLREVLASHLLSQRHHLALAHRMVGRRDRATRLAGAARALDRLAAPPTGLACVGVDSEGVPLLVRSDGAGIRGGSTPTGGTDQLPVIWSRAQGLDAQAARPLMRAWARRGSDDSVRAAIALDLDADDVVAEQLVRWLRATAQLRRARLWLEHARR